MKKLNIHTHPAQVTAPRGTMNGKTVYLAPAKTVLSLKSDFSHKLLCDGPTFSPGSACAYSCSFCYVGAIMLKNPHFAQARQDKQNFSDVVIRRNNAVEVLRSQLFTKSGNPKYTDQKDQRVIFTSPLVDVAANLELVAETIELSRLILKNTNWQIRFLSKSNFLPRIAEALEEYKERMIFGVSTGTLDDKLAAAIEIGTPKVSKRIESLHWLQDHGFRTYGMICPSLPVEDFDKFSREICKAIRVEKCEHVWAEVINLRGDSLVRTAEALRGKGFANIADRLEAAKGDLWQEYARQTFLAHAKNIPSKKLRFMQYVKKKDIAWWQRHEKSGALLLGRAAKNFN
ncbi:MAG: radical SAM protein [Opitutaceae bacterium]